ncbi:hypothetical protein C1646_768343 [Rhizophagus diaphanus]|nr:hypothetical protein C1646_768343 [Rhizophagus diaphanus] [Rhizophagus sp. MUCL 43196]
MTVLMQLCDKVINAEDGKQLDKIIRSGGSKFGEKKARSILYDMAAIMNLAEFHQSSPK